MSKERWADIPGYEGLYQVSDQGRVRSLRRKPPRLMAACRHTNGYRQAHFHVEGARRAFLVHRLVAFAFIPRVAGFDEVNHIDRNRANNRADNLEWCDRKGNVAHALTGAGFEAGRIARCNAVIGRSVASPVEYVRFESQSAAEKALSPTGTNTSAIHNALTGKSRLAFGFTWERA